MPHRITLIPGDGIGPEIAQATCYVLQETGVHIKWAHADAGLVALEKHGQALPEQTLEAVRQSRVALKGPTTTPVGGGHTSANVQLRRSLDLFASIRPVRSSTGIPSRYQGIDLVVFRENTEGLYSGQENEVAAGVVASFKVVTEAATRRIAIAAFNYARAHGRKTVTAVHKANIMKLGDGLFLKICREVATEYSDITYDEAIIDALCMRLVSRPEQFDVLLMPNLYGDIVSDLCAGLVGGLGVVPGANIGKDIAVFEAVHGSAPDIAGKNIANPTALLRSAVLMLAHIGELSAAERLDMAIDRVLTAGNCLTSDLGGDASTTAFAEAVAGALRPR